MRDVALWLLLLWLRLAVAAAFSSPPRLSSVFVELSATRAGVLDRAGWDAELAAMRDVGVSSVITKFSAYNHQRHESPDPNVTYPAYYATRLPWLSQSGDNDRVELLLAAAD